MLVAAELFLVNEDLEDSVKSTNESSTKDGRKIKTRVPIPRSYPEAMNDPIYGSKWREAIHVELRNHLAFGTW